VEEAKLCSDINKRNRDTQRKEKKKKKKNGTEILEQEGMAHGEPMEHRERVEGGAKA
jgi:hypothetical protein